MLQKQIESLDVKVRKSEESLHQSEEKYEKIKIEMEDINSLASNLYNEYTILAKERDCEIMKGEIDKSHMETKIRLLKEVLTKKNKDYQTAEDNNRELVAFIEK